MTRIFTACYQPALQGAFKPDAEGRMCPINIDKAEVYGLTT